MFMFELKFLFKSSDDCFGFQIFELSCQLRSFHMLTDSNLTFTVSGPERKCSSLDFLIFPQKIRVIYLPAGSSYSEGWEAQTKVLVGKFLRTKELPT